VAIWNRKSKPPSDYRTAVAYDGLRSQVLALDPAQVGLTPSEFGPVWGLLMETGYPEAVATLVALGDGTVSLYFSNGGGIIGVGGHEGPRQACRELLAFAPAFLDKVERAAEHPLPAQGRTRFSLLTFNGVFAAEATENDLGENRHPLSPLFYKAQAVITQARLVSQAQPPYLAVVEADSPAIGADGALVQSLGIETRGRVFAPLLERGTPVPCEVSETFSTAEAAQDQITITLCRGNSDSAADCEPLGRFRVSKIERPPTGAPLVQVTLAIRGRDVVLSARNPASKTALVVEKVGDGSSGA
jgi:hypothetical protein